MKLSDAEQVDARWQPRPGDAEGDRAVDAPMRTLGAQRFVETTERGRHSRFHHAVPAADYRESGGSYAAIFSHFDLDSDELLDVPQAVPHTCTCRAATIRQNWKLLGAKPEAFELAQGSEQFIKCSAASRF